MTDKFYKEDFDGMGYSFVTELALLENGKNKRTDLSETTFYGGILEYNKFLKDCYMQHHPFFKTIGKKIDALDKYIPK